MEMKCNIQEAQHMLEFNAPLMIGKPELIEFLTKHADCKLSFSVNISTV